MQLKHLTFAALAGAVAAQSMDINAALSNNNMTSQLALLINSLPNLTQRLQGESNITLLAPSNDALSKLLSSEAGRAIGNNTAAVEALLSYHVLNGTYSASQITNMSSFISTQLTNETYTNVTGGQVVQAVMVGDNTLFYSGLLQNSTVVSANVEFTNGIIHVIDTVLTIPLNVSATATAFDLTALNGAINSTDLNEVVDTTPDLTIFAPNNAAFRDIGAAIVNLSISDLTSILGYHVVNGTVGYSSTLTNGSMLTTMAGGNVTITLDGTNVFVNSARVVQADVLVANGVVHVIDNVLNPNATTAATASATSGAAAFTATTTVTDIPFTSGQATPTSSLVQQSAGPAASSTNSGAAMPARTGAAGMAALFGGAAAVMAF